MNCMRVVADLEKKGQERQEAEIYPGSNFLLGQVFCDQKNLRKTAFIWKFFLAKMISRYLFNSERIQKKKAYQGSFRKNSEEASQPGDYRGGLRWQAGGNGGSVWNGPGRSAVISVLNFIAHPCRSIWRINWKAPELCLRFWWHLSSASITAAPPGRMSCRLSNLVWRCTW